MHPLQCQRLSLSCLVVNDLLQEHGDTSSSGGGIVGAAAQGNSLPSGRARGGEVETSEEVEESEDCSRLVVSRGEELREIAPSVASQVVDGEEAPSTSEGKEKEEEEEGKEDKEVEEEREEEIDRAECSVETVVVDETRATFVNPLLEGISASSSCPLPSLEEAETALENPLLTESCVVVSPPLSPLSREEVTFENPLLRRSSAATSQLLSPLDREEAAFENPLLVDLFPPTSVPHFTTTTTTASPPNTAATTTLRTGGDQEYNPTSPPWSGSIEYDPETVIEEHMPSTLPASLATTTTTTTVSPPFLQRVLDLVAEELTAIDFFSNARDEAVATASAAISAANNDTDTTAVAAVVKVETEEPDWENVHQQSEELQLRPYQRRFENRPLETCVFLLDPDSEHPSLGADEEVGREIDSKREPDSEDEEIMGIDWSLAHEINRLDLEERESCEVPDEIRAQGAQINLDEDESSISSKSSSKDSLLAGSEEEDDEEYVADRPRKSRRKGSKRGEEEEAEEEEEKVVEEVPDVSSLSSDESDSSILSEGTLALKNMTADSSESEDDDWEPSASRAARLAAKPKHALRTQIRAAAAVSRTPSTTTTTTVAPVIDIQNYTTIPTTSVSSASPPVLPLPAAPIEVIDAEDKENIAPSPVEERPEPSAVEEESHRKSEEVPDWRYLLREPFKHSRRRFTFSDRIIDLVDVGERATHCR